MSIDVGMKSLRKVKSRLLPNQRTNAPAAVPSETPFDPFLSYEKLRLLLLHGSLFVRTTDKSRAIDSLRQRPAAGGVARSRAATGGLFTHTRATKKPLFALDIGKVS